MAGMILHVMTAPTSPAGPLEACTRFQAPREKPALECFTLTVASDVMTCLIEGNPNKIYALRHWALASGCRAVEQHAHEIAAGLYKNITFPDGNSTYAGVANAQQTMGSNMPGDSSDSLVFS
jgi:hypothetical protein